ncbi:MAG: hypothetical protein QM713_04370 [Arachnia sp.]
MGARDVVAGSYRLNGSKPVAYIDETYNLDDRWAKFYVMTAVVVQADQRDLVRRALIARAGCGYWHTSEALRSSEGRRRAHDLLDYLGHPEGSEFCVIAHARAIEEHDTDGEQARAGCLTQILSRLSALEDSVELFLLERRRGRRQSNQDAQTKTDAVRAGHVPRHAQLLQLSPGDEPLLWLPDLVCSAYRRQLTADDATLFCYIDHICQVLP